MSVFVVVDIAAITDSKTRTCCRSWARSRAIPGERAGENIARFTVV
jgi:hypothetical protein